MDDLRFLEGLDNLEKLSIMGIDCDDFEILIKLSKLKTVDVDWRIQGHFSQELRQKVNRQKMSPFERDFSAASSENWT